MTNRSPHQAVHIASFQTDSPGETLYKAEHPDGPWWEVISQRHQDLYHTQAALNNLGARS